jgi:S1-C subfamily serine protease
VHVSSGGSAVSIGGGRYVTASHLVEGLQRYAVELEIGGVWKHGRMSTVEGRDAAVITCDDDGGIPTVELGTPQYGERVTVIGLKSGVPQRGTISDTRTVSLDVECAGIEQGDSGGGVFADDGALVGIISARNPDEPRVVYFTHARAVLSLVSSERKL